jgi:hypothetical protein
MMRVALFLFIIAGFEQWIHGCQARKFRYFSAATTFRRAWAAARLVGAGRKGVTDDKWQVIRDK